MAIPAWILGMMSQGGQAASGKSTPQYDPTGTGTQQANNPVKNELALQSMYLRKDKGFYGHMTVGKAKKGKKVCIIGKGC